MFEVFMMMIPCSEGGNWVMIIFGWKREELTGG
jgi:hypothetical protein